MFAAANEMDVKTVPKASVSGAGNSLAASHQMQAGTTKMNDGNAQLAQGNSGGNVAVNAPTTTTTNVKNTTHRGAIPTAMDKSDRTDRRGRSRGTG
jgi:X-X-X-Leu-X-X-Gly heptad repeat protein